MKRNWKSALILFLGLMLSRNALSQQRMVKAWPASPALHALESLRLTAPDPTLSAPQLQREPEYTWGNTNTLHWSSAAVANLLIESGHALLAFEIEASYPDQGETVVLWGFTAATADSATFDNLPEGIRIDYRLRYYARSSAGDYLMSHWSNTVSSIQDLKPPKLHALTGVEQVQTIGGQRWVVGDLIQIRVVASDSTFGKVMQIGVEETSNSHHLVTLHTVIPPRLHVDTTLQHVLQTPMKTPLTIRLWATDVALQRSEDLVESLVWWPDDEGVGKLLCFPNPFTPGPSVEPLKVKVGVPGVTQARIFDPFGNLVRLLEKSEDDPFFQWDGRNGEGEWAASGGYICVADGKTDLYCKIAIIR